MEEGGKQEEALSCFSLWLFSLFFLFYYIFRVLSGRSILTYKHLLLTRWL